MGSGQEMSPKKEVGMTYRHEKCNQVDDRNSSSQEAIRNNHCDTKREDQTPRSQSKIEVLIHTS